ncbi:MULTISPECIES: dienelactone hydrolase family protein [Polymorphospora]|uniref:Dienelactone hydrolase family protein n=1 Tax=Polymorphospora lycopeni TaxID=3140240 RepID=A0ABV5D2Y5_9ACTN
MNVQTTETQIKIGQIRLDADLVVPPDAEGLVVFAHGSGSSRHSPRNRAVAAVFNERHLATLLVDLLTPEEEQTDLQTAELRFDIGLLADRLVNIVDWLGDSRATPPLPIGLFGASTGGAAALVAAAAARDHIRAVVSRGGRPDLAGPALGDVRAPVLLLVGELDHDVLELNRQAAKMLCAGTELRIIPGATHLFEEPGALEQVADEAATWFHDHLTMPA